MGLKKYSEEFNERIVSLYKQGLDQKVIVEQMGCDYSKVRYELKRAGIYDPARRVHNTAHAQGYNQNQKQEALARLSFKLLQHGFAYISGYDGRNSKCTIKCMTCGGLVDRVPAYLTKYECPHCIKAANDKKLATKLMDRLLRESLREIEKEQKEKEKAEKHTLPLTCNWCGREFTLSEYEEREGVSNVAFASYCSSKCRKKSEKSRYDDTHGKHRLRAKKYGTPYESGITLGKLVERDGLRCALCGELCDWNDKSYGSCGPRYPSIDHIVPMSKGGAHSWNNVQIAHCECNSAKGDLTDRTA